MSEVVNVAAAVILRSEGSEYLLAQRPPAKVYAGYWEFPGGKVEPGETVHQALVRELDEELGIAVDTTTPWLIREFSYPHADVRLHFRRVTAWHGDITAREHSAIRWLRIGAKPDVDPLLPANAPILKALRLPTVMAITNMSENGEDAELTRLQNAVAGGLRLFQLRDKNLPPVERAWFAQAAREMVRGSGSILLINDDESLVRAVQANGVHLSSTNLQRCATRPELPWVGASCHTADDLQRAADLGLDYAVLGSVLPTLSHPGSPGLGWEAFARLAGEARIPVFALGGLQRADLPQAQACGAHGVALMRQW